MKHFYLLPTNDSYDVMYTTYLVSQHKLYIYPKYI